MANVQVIGTRPDYKLKDFQKQPSGAFPRTPKQSPGFTSNVTRKSAKRMLG